MISHYWEMLLSAIFMIVGFVIAATIVEITPLRELPLFLWYMAVGVGGFLMSWVLIIVFAGVYYLVKGVHALISGRKKKRRTFTKTRNPHR